MNFIQIFKRQVSLYPRFQGHRLLHFFTCIFLTVLCYLFFASFLFPNSDIVAYQPLWCFLLAAVLGIVLWAIWKLAGLLCENQVFLRQRGMAVVLLLGLLLPLQYIIFKSVYYQPGWDVSILTESGYWLALEQGIPSNFLDYFACYPNNVTLLMIWAYMTKLLIRVFGYYDYLFAAIMLSAVMTNMALYFAFKVADRCFGPRKALTMLAMGIPLLAFAPWMVNPYSDTMSILFPVLGLWLWLLGREPERKRWQKLLLLLMCGGGLAFGMRIKPTVAVMLIALLLTDLLRCRSREAWCSFAKAAVVVVVAFCTVAVPLDFFCTRIMTSSGVTEERIEETKYPMTHFLMMGMQKQPSPFNGERWQYGKWYAGDMNITYGQVGQQAKIRENLRVVGERLKEFGPLGYLRFLNDKARWVLGDGTMYFGGEVPTDVCFQQTPLAHLLQKFFWQPGEYYPVTAHLLQAVWMLVLGLCCMPIFRREDRYKERVVACCRLGVCGIILFILLFEGRARYLINFLPLFLVLAAYGLPTKERPIQQEASR